MTRSDRLEHALAAIDRLHEDDPEREAVETVDRKDAADTGNGVERPAALLYAERMSAWIERLAPAASDALRVAARAQHLRRWERPRADFPAGRAGYLAWRRAAQKHHAQLAARVLTEHGWESETIARVAELIEKRRLRTDPETQALEDAACLVFLEHGLADFASRHERDKVVDILRKTWRKMSEAGRVAALALELGELGELVGEALGSPSGGPSALGSASPGDEVRR